MPIPSSACRGQRIQGGAYRPRLLFVLVLPLLAAVLLSALHPSGQVAACSHPRRRRSWARPRPPSLLWPGARRHRIRWRLPRAGALALSLGRVLGSSTTARPPSSSSSRSRANRERRWTSGSATNAGSSRAGRGARPPATGVRSVFSSPWRARTAIGPSRSPERRATCSRSRSSMGRGRWIVSGTRGITSNIPQLSGAEPRGSDVFRDLYACP